MSTTGRFTLAIALLSSVAVFACGAEGPESAPTVDIVAEEYEFQGPDTVRGGWLTLRLHNQGSETHYMEIDRLPEEVTFAEFRSRVERMLIVRDSVFALLGEEAIDRAEAGSILRSVAPDGFWGGSLFDYGRDTGGIGLVGPGETARTTLRLEPGTYALVCGMPTANDGDPHHLRGMIASLVVVGPSTEAQPPPPDVVMRHNGGEVSTEGTFRAGRQVLAFHVDSVAGDEDDGALGAYLARLDDGIRSKDLIRWVTEGRYQPPAPTTFLGGIDEIGEGDSAYVTLDLKTGRYGWVMYPFGSDTDPFVEELTVE